MHRDRSVLFAIFATALLFLGVAYFDLQQQVAHRDRRDSAAATAAGTAAAGVAGQTPLSGTTNYASAYLGATLVDFTRECRGTSAILNDDKEKYMICPCATPRKQMTVHLIRDIEVRIVGVTNREYFSSGVRNFTLLGSQRYPTNQWHVMGSFQAENRRGTQLFHVGRHAPVRFLRFQWVTASAHQSWCTMTSLQVYGVDALDTLAEDYDLGTALGDGLVGAAPERPSSGSEDDSPAATPNVSCPSSPTADTPTDLSGDANAWAVGSPLLPLELMPPPCDAKAADAAEVRSATTAVGALLNAGVAVGHWIQDAPHADGRNGERKTGCNMSTSPWHEISLLTTSNSTVCLESERDWTAQSDDLQVCVGVSPPPLLHGRRTALGARDQRHKSAQGSTRITTAGVLPESRHTTAPSATALTSFEELARRAAAPGTPSSSSSVAVAGSRYAGSPPAQQGSGHVSSSVGSLMTQLGKQQRHMQQELHKWSLRVPTLEKELRVTQAQLRMSTQHHREAAKVAMDQREALAALARKIDMLETTFALQMEDVKRAGLTNPVLWIWVCCSNGFAFLALTCTILSSRQPHPTMAHQPNAFGRHQRANPALAHQRRLTFRSSIFF